MKFIKILLLLLPFSCLSQSPVRTVTFKSALDELFNVASLPAYLDQTICAQVSSYDTTGGNDDGFSGRYSFIHRNPDSTMVIFEVKGPGVINRIWTPTPSEDSLAFYIDNLVKPAFTIRYLDLFSGKVFPFIHPLCNNQLGGFYCYLPIPFKERCRIVYKGKKTQFHQIQYRLYPPGTLVNSFKLPLTVEETKALRNTEVIESMFSVTNAYGAKNLIEESRDINLRPGQTQSLFKTETGGRIVALEIGPISALEGYFNQVDIRITWDNQSVPAIYCPLADFLGMAFGKASMNSWLMGSFNNKGYCFFPMPYDQSASIDLVYRKIDQDTPKPISLHSKIIYVAQKRNRESEGKLYAQWRRTTLTKFHQPQVFVETAGKGHLVATLLLARGLKAGMTYFFEGDDSTAVDGQFRMHGTGSEDYFNGGWYALSDRWDAAMSLPLSGSLDYSLPFCRTGGYRLFLSDKISFEKNIYHSIEHGPTNNIEADYTSLALYYGSASAKALEPPTNATTKIYHPDTLVLYPQLLNMGIEGDFSTKTSWSYPTGGMTYTFTFAENSSIRIPLEVPPGNYHLYLDDVTGPSGADISVWQRQALRMDRLSRYSAVKKREEKTFLCLIAIDALVNTITFNVKTAPGKDQFIFNRLVLVRDRD